MLPTLPNEIWTRILSIVRDEQDLPESWMSHRFVSRAFKNAVEKAFCEQHLRKTWITFHLGTIKDKDDDSMNLIAEFEFSHLSEDGSLAHFKIEPFNEDYRSEIIAGLEKCPRDAIEKPQHYVQIHRELNDTPVPSLSISPSNLTLSCDWKGLYTWYCREEILFAAYTDTWVKSQEEWMKSVQAKVARGEMDLGSVLEKAIHAYGENSDINRRRARKARMKRQWAERGEGTVKDEEPEDEKSEDRRMKIMAKARQFASKIADSDFGDSGGESEGDDDDDDEEEDEDEDESEGDGWETDENEGDGKNEDSEEDTPVVHA